MRPESPELLTTALESYRLAWRYSRRAHPLRASGDTQAGTIVLFSSRPGIKHVKHVKAPVEPFGATQPDHTQPRRLPLDRNSQLARRLLDAVKTKR